VSAVQRRNVSIPAIALLAVVGLIFAVVAIIYFAEPATSLPSFFPGHQAGSNHHHTTHGIAALVVGLIGLAGAWWGQVARRLDRSSHFPRAVDGMEC
jgi:multisubunit Na+/H+ antiporter MnhB subunit